MFTCVFVSNTAIAIGCGIVNLELYRFGKVCDGTVIIAFIVVSHPAIVIGSSQLRIEFQSVSVMLNGFIVLLSIVMICQTSIKLRVGTLVNAFISNKFVKVVVDGFGRYAVVLFQVV